MAGTTNILKSTGALLAGFMLTFVFSVLTDLALEKAGLMKLPFNSNSVAFIAGVIFYRSAYTVAGCYLTATLAPARPMRHALMLGSIGLLACIAGAIVMWHEPPHWYPVSLIILTLPSAWLGGKFKENKKHPFKPWQNQKT